MADYESLIIGSVKCFKFDKDSLLNKERCSQQCGSSSEHASEHTNVREH
jgi:hypothetical protein